MLRARTASEGGPYRLWRCKCGADNGALQNFKGGWLLHPLEGFTEPDFIDRWVPRQTRETQAIAVEWWRRNAADVQRFRLGERARARRTVPREEAAGERPSRPPPAPETRARNAQAPGADAGAEAGAGTRAAPPPGAARNASSPDYAEQSPLELLGVTEAASQEEIRAAYRKAVKLCHPDRVANLDPDIQALAHRKSMALRDAYESLLDR